MCVFIFHKNEVLAVILSCLTGLNLDLVKSYGLRCNLRPRASSVNSQKIATDKWKIYEHIWPFLANYMLIFHKIEVQKVILVCLTGLKFIWFKGYDTECKYLYFWFFAILYKNRHLPLLRFLHFSVFCHNFCTNKDLDSLSTSKWPSASQFYER